VQNTRTVEKLVLSKSETATALGIGLVTLDDKLLKPGLLRSLKIGSRVVVPRQELERFLAGHK
jgi:hypothetical protein